MKLVLFSLLGLAGMAFYGLSAVSSPGQRSRIPIQRAPEHRAITTGAVQCATRDARIELVPDAVVVDRGRELVEYHAEVTVLRGKNVGVAWKAFITDDRGSVVSSLGEGAATALKDAAISTGPLLPNLPDGFYVLQVRAAISPQAEAEDVLETVQYLEMSGGHTYELTDVEWFQRSRAREAFKVDDSMVDTVLKREAP